MQELLHMATRSSPQNQSNDKIERTPDKELTVLNERADSHCQAFYNDFGPILKGVLYVNLEVVVLFLFANTI